ncbi:hypothetical protein SELMODRAFT_96579 [Selaginella moellendorffii]|uniref:Urease accessory protein UreF n=2 Tax=Selaginella moellendorffii TaxID=88036 RepID=D8RLY9_SELML|nr:hypothetical protein SELMODRAFT_97029 [Selaginella moellendorffii]EFJ27010.1 hypothetical protein SELMODRAFT_96579 [Selaginella moellendorffii]
MDLPAKKSQGSDWVVWQLVDSFFPTGGFAHSYGLEAAVQAGLVSDSKSLDTFIKSTLENSGSLLLPFVSASFKLPDVAGWIELDRLLNATLSNHVARRASSSQGSALLRTAATVYPDLAELGELRGVVRAGRASGHHAGVFGIVCGLLKLDALTCQRAYLYLTLRDVLSAATRLNLVGPLQAAAMQQSLRGFGEAVVRKCADRGVEDACQVSPLLDTAQACHDHLFSRLFCS